MAAAATEAVEARAMAEAAAEAAMTQAGAVVEAAERNSAQLEGHYSRVRTDAEAQAEDNNDLNR